MTELEHKHEWEIEPYHAGLCRAYCAIESCDAELNHNEIEQRLDATECLSADEAESIAFGLPDEYGMLNDYVKMLKEIRTC